MQENGSSTISVEEQKRRKRRDIFNWIGFFILGTVNNLSYVVVNTLSQQIVEFFHKENLLGLVIWLNAGFGFFVRLIHSMFMLRIPFTIRMIISSSIYLLGLLGCAFSFYLGIFVSFVSILFIGASCSLGESILVGYISLFPPSSVGAFSSGTGCAGLLGAAICLLFTTLHLSLLIDFLILIPFLILYFFVYLLWIKKPGEEELVEIMEEKKRKKQMEEEEKIKENKAERMKSGNESDKIESSSFSDSSSYSTTTTSTTISNSSTSFQRTDADQINSSISMENENELNKNNEDETIITEETYLISERKKESVFQRLWRVWKLIGSISIQLMLVYTFEYIVTSGAADIAVPKSWREEEGALYFVRESFVIINLAYQLGVFISRSSLSLCKIRYVIILTFIQLINLIFWIFQDIFHFIKGYAILILFFHSIFVGLLGGSMYVNVLYLILSNPSLSSADLELSTNITMIFVTLGITLSSIGSLLLKNVFFKHVQ